MTTLCNITVTSYFIPFDQQMQPLLIEIEKREAAARSLAEMATMDRVKGMATDEFP